MKKVALLLCLSPFFACENPSSNDDGLLGAWYVYDYGDGVKYSAATTEEVMVIENGVVTAYERDADTVWVYSAGCSVVGNKILIQYSATDIDTNTFTLSNGTMTLGDGYSPPSILLRWPSSVPPWPNLRHVIDQ